MVVGSPEQIAEQIKTKVLDAGVDGVILNLSPASRLPAGRHHRGGRDAEAAGRPAEPTADVATSHRARRKRGGYRTCTE